MLVGEVIARHVLPDMAAEAREQLVKAMVAGSIGDGVPDMYDPLLVPVIDEIKAREHMDIPKSLLKAMDQHHEAAQGKAAQPHMDMSREKRKYMAKSQKETPKQYRARIPGNGLIPGVRVVQVPGTCIIQGHYPKLPGDVRGSRWQYWAEGHQSKAEAEKIVIDWMWARHERAVEIGFVPMAPDGDSGHDSDSDMASNMEGNDGRRRGGRGRGRAGGASGSGVIVNATCVRTESNQLLK